MAKYAIEIDPALLTRDEQEFEPVAYRQPVAGEYTLDGIGRINQNDNYGPRLILRPKRWEPKEGEECLFLSPEDDGWLTEWKWHGCEWQIRQLKDGTCWPLSRRAHAEACVERVKAAIKGGE